MGTVRRKMAKAKRLFSKACACYARGEFKNASVLFEGLLSSGASTQGIEDLELWLAASHFENSDYEKAGPLLDGLVRTVDTEMEPQFRGCVLSFAGQCHSKISSFETAVSLLDRLEEYAQALIDKEQIWLLYKGRYERAHSLLWLGKPEDSLKTLDLAESGVPRGAIPAAVKAELDYERAVALDHVGEHHKAVRMLETVDPNLFRDDSKPEYWFWRVRMHEWVKEHDKALAAFETLEALGIPDALSSEAHHWVGRAYYYLGKGPESVQHFRESMKHPYSHDWLAESNESHLAQLKKAGWG